MLSFRSNFFFLQFSVLFFIITILGFWSIDLNSEEIYIAFSFFIIFVLGFIFFRANLMLLFMRLLVGKYSAIVGSLLKIRRLSRVQSRDFRLQSARRFDFLHSCFCSRWTTSEFWVNKFFSFYSVSSLPWMKRALRVIVLTSSASFFAVSELRLVSFKSRLNFLFNTRLS